MPALSKATYEAVAQALASGKTQRDAYQAGGYVYRPANAHRLCTSPAITARVKEIVAHRFGDERKAREIAVKKAGLHESWIIERAKYAVELALRGAPILDAEGQPTGQFDGKRNLVSTWCSTNANRERIGDVAMQAGSCLGYLSSIIDIQSSGNAVNGKKACIPQNADISQMVDLFKNYVRDHPDRRHLLAANLAAEAFALAFPCRP